MSDNKTSLVKFRPVEREDLELLQSWRNDPEIRLICREYRQLSLDHQVYWYENTILDTDCMMFVITAADKGNPIGVCGWTFIDWRSRHALLSLYIGDPSYRNEDYYAAIFTELHRVAFKELGLHVVRAEIYDFDPRKEMFFKAGYKETGRRRQQYFHNGRFWDIIITDIVDES